MSSASEGQKTTGSPLRVVWTRGKGCVELADLLAGGSATRVQNDVRAECVEARADLLVSRRLSTNFDFVNMAVPFDFRVERVGSVFAAVSGGPHSTLAARLALRLGDVLDVDAEMVSAYPTPNELPAAREIVDRLAEEVPGIPYRVVETPSARELIAGLPDDALLVLGAPGGWWLQRAFFGRGVRLRQQAPAGAIVVQRAQARVYHHMEEPAYVSRHLLVGDALALMEHSVSAVVEEGVLVGVVAREALEDADVAARVEDLMDDPVYLEVGAAYEEAARLNGLFRGAPIPVTDTRGHLVGCVVAPS